MLFQYAFQYVFHRTMAIERREELENLVADLRLSYNRGQASLGDLVSITGNGGSGELDPSLAESGLVKAEVAFRIEFLNRYRYLPILRFLGKNRTTPIALAKRVDQMS